MNKGKSHKGNNSPLRNIETPRQAQAFELYFSMGDGQRSIRKVAQKMHIADRTLTTWSKKFDWESRLIKRQAELSKKLAKQTDIDILAAKKIIQQSCKALIAGMFEQQKDGSSKLRFRIESAADFERVGKMWLLILGEATEKIEFKNFAVAAICNVINIEIADPSLRDRIYQRICEISFETGGQQTALPTPAENPSESRSND